MERIYNTAETNKPDFFIGLEVEKTPAFNERTLFVVGLQKPEMIIDLAVKNRCKHIYLGANHSYIGDDTSLYVDLIYAILIGTEFKVTFDFPVGCYDKLYDSLLNTSTGKHQRFIPMIRAAMVGVEHINPNTTLKIDDKTFDYSNKAVWCHPVKNLLDANQATYWPEYGQDEIIK